MKESIFETAFCNYLEKRGWITYKIESKAGTKSGISDVVGIWKGKSTFFELKTDSDLRPEQIYFLRIVENSVVVQYPEIEKFEIFYKGKKVVTLEEMEKWADIK